MYPWIAPICVCLELRRNGQRLLRWTPQPTDALAKLTNPDGWNHVTVIFRTSSLPEDLRLPALRRAAPEAYTTLALRLQGLVLGAQPEALSHLLHGAQQAGYRAGQAELKNELRTLLGVGGPI